MNRSLGLACLLVLAGCAHDNYVATAGDPGAMQSTLQGCKDAALYSYFHNRDHSAVLVGALLGGAVGGALAASVTTDGGPDRRARINPDIEACMARAGYIGTSEN